MIASALSPVYSGNFTGRPMFDRFDYSIRLGVRMSYAVRRNGFGLATVGVFTLILIGTVGRSAHGQNAFYAGIAYSQSTGKIGYTTRQARTEDEAQKLAAQSCGTPDAKTYIWGPDQWVAIAVVDGTIGTAGFGRGDTSDEAQRKALDECVKRARGEACRVAFCIHSQGMRPQALMSIARDPKLPPPTPKSGFFAAIAYSPSTGKIGSTSGKAKSKEEAQALALKNCGAKDAKAFMWGEQWIAIAVANDLKGVAGFAPGATREAAEQAALAQCKRYGHGAASKIALSLNAAGEPAAKDAKPQVAKSAPAANSKTPTAGKAPAVTPASVESPAAKSTPKK